METMHLIQNNQLTPQELQALEALYQHCQQADQGAPILYRNLLIEPREGNKNALYYHHDELIGFISIYMFYATACEITLFVHPDHRRQKIATQLLLQMLPQLKANHIEQVIFSMAPPRSEQDIQWLDQRGFKPHESEYCMHRLSPNPALIAPSPLTIRPATIQDIPALIQLEVHCFPENPPHNEQHFTDLLRHNPQYKVLTANYQGKVIGKAHLYFEKSLTNEATLSDIAILPTFQRQGFGGQLVAYCINIGLALQRSTLRLNVALNNPHAIQLYLQHGFQIEAQYDYWIITLDKLEQAQTAIRGE